MEINPSVVTILYLHCGKSPSRLCGRLIGRGTRLAFGPIAIAITVPA